MSHYRNHKCNEFLVEGGGTSFAPPTRPESLSVDIVCIFTCCPSQIQHLLVGRSVIYIFLPWPNINFSLFNQALGMGQAVCLEPGPGICYPDGGYPTDTP